MTSLITQIQHYSLHNGPGTRTTVFFKGCPLNCAWCHNPENISPQQEIFFTKKNCIGCGECKKVCSYVPNSPACNRCGECVTACPSGARALASQVYTVQKLLPELLENRIFYEESSGGVTLSGGEPLLHYDFLQELLPVLHREEISVALDTCGYAPSEHFLNIASQVSCVLFDLKAVDSLLHRKYTGVTNGLILKNLKALSTLSPKPELWIRIPVIPGVNDTPREVDAMCELIQSLPVAQVNLLPYHRMGVSKYTRLGREYTLGDVTDPTGEQMEALREKFARTQKLIKIGSSPEEARR